jgi:protein-tyrosine-phosphatase
MQKYNVLFLCTHNTSRSILAEAIAQTLANGRLQAYSAGVQPGAEVNPLALELADEMGANTSKLQPKSVQSFTGADAPKMDFVIALSDTATAEQPPTFPGSPITASWSFADPALAEGNYIERKRAFVAVMNGLQKRIAILAALPLHALDALSLKDIHHKA